METLVVNRRVQLQEIVQLYVNEGLSKGNFDAIPYHEEIKLRNPLTPESETTPLMEKNLARETYWKTLPELVEKCILIDTSIHENQQAVTFEVYCYIRQPKVKVRIVDCLRIDDEGRIYAQENLIYGMTPNFDTDMNHQSHLM